MKRFPDWLMYRWAWPGLLVAALAWLALPHFAPPLFALALIHLVMSQRLRAVEGDAPSLWDPVCVFCSLVIFEVHYLLISHFTGDLFEPELLSGAFDSLASAFARGDAAVDPGAIRWEGMQVDGRTYMYFGPLPAFLRMPVMWAFPDLQGQWSRLSCFFAAALSVCGFSLLCARRLASNTRFGVDTRRLLLQASMLGLGLGTPLAFVLFAGTLYNESILWAFCCGIWSLHLALCCFEEGAPTDALLVGLACLVGVTLLARLTYGAPLVGVFGLVLIRRLQAEWSGPMQARIRGVLRVAVCGLPLLVMISFQLGYNHERFGSLFVAVDHRLLEYLVDDEASWAAYEAHGAVNVRRIPSALHNYFGLRGDAFAAEFPWIRVARPAYPETGLYPKMFNSHVISLSIVSAWLLVAALAGWGLLVRRPGEWLLKLCGLGFVTQALLVASYFIMEQRYSMDLFPVLLFGYAFFLSDSGKQGPASARTRAIPILLVTLVAISIVTTTLSTLSEIPVSGRQVSQSYKALWLSRFRAVNLAQAKLFGSSSEDNDPEPASPQR